MGDHRLRGRRRRILPHGGHQRLVFAQRLAEVGVLDGGEHPDREAAVPDPVEAAEQVLVAGLFHDAPVDRPVGVEVRLHATARDRLLGLDGPPDPFEGRRVPALGDDAGRVPLDRLARLATESSVSPTASHPFWARPFPDVAIVHNGQITDHYLWRNRLERRGYRFMSENDSELIAVWISDRMRRGMTKPAALGQSIREIDGVFTYLIADERSIGFAKDRWAIKPLVAMGDAPELAVATEEQAVRRIYREEGDVTNFDGPALTRTWLAAAAAATAESESAADASMADASAVEAAA